MPPHDFKSITISKDVFDRFDLIYKTRKKRGELSPGIVSFSSFFTEQMENMMKEKKSFMDYISKIKFVPAKFTETKLVIKKI